MISPNIARVSMGALLAASLLVGCGMQETTTPDANANPQTEVGTATTTIDLNQAKEAALEHAGLDADEVTFVHVSQGNEDGRRVWEIEFVAGGVEYDYDIDAITGDVLSFDQDAENTTGADISPSDLAITPAEAQASAFDHAGVAEEDVLNLTTNLGEEDGQQVYEVEFDTSDISYSYVIDPETGAVISHDLDAD